MLKENLRNIKPPHKSFIGWERTSFFLVFFSFILLKANSQSLKTENLQVSIIGGEKKLQEIFQMIQEQSHLSFSYNNSKIDIDKKYLIESEQISLDKFLQKLSRITDLKFKRINHHIVVSSSSKKASRQYTVSGYVKCKDSGEELFGATIYENQQQRGAVTNYYGFFSVTLDEGPVTFEVSYVGYDPLVFSFELKEELEIKEILLIPNEGLDEVIVTADPSEPIVESVNMGQFDVPIQEMKNLPIIGGEPDIIKVLQLTPGVHTGTEGASGLSVRGGGFDQNLYLLDRIPLYNVGHVGGFFSVFNSDALSNVKLIKGGFPARFGGRLSSILDVKMKEGNNREYHGQGSIGLVASRISIEGPILRDRSSFIISFRRTYLDLFTWPISKIISKGDDGWGFNFYDLNTKINHKISNKDHVYVSFYNGDDRLRTESGGSSFGDDIISDYKERTVWGNMVTSMRWNHLFSDRLFGNISIHFSRYRIKNINNSTWDNNTNDNIPKTEKYYNGLSGIKDYGFNFSLDYFLKKHQLTVGGSITMHQFFPEKAEIKLKNSPVSPDLNTRKQNDLLSLEYAYFLQDEWDIRKNIRLNMGLHHSIFTTQGKTYHSVQPRFSFRYLVLPNFALKASYSGMQQNIHLLVDNTEILPTDQWMPVTPKIGPQYARQGAVGLAHSFLDNQWEVTLDAYYKKMNGLIEYKEEISYSGNLNNWEESIESGGTGLSRGIEFLVRKESGKINGWLGYTLSKTERQFTNINNGKSFPFKYDRRHNISLVTNYQLKEHIKLSSAWVYLSGAPITLPIVTYHAPAIPFESNLYQSHFYLPFQILSERNQLRTPPTHHLDVSISLDKQKGKFLRTWVFSIYNLYNNKNPFSIFLSNEISGDSDNLMKKTHFVQSSFFQMVPSFSYQLKF